MITGMRIRRNSHTLKLGELAGYASLKLGELAGYASMYACISMLGTQRLNFLRSGKLVQWYL